jgi:hypothetical protein
MNDVSEAKQAAGTTTGKTHERGREHVRAARACACMSGASDRTGFLFLRHIRIHMTWTGGKVTWLNVSSHRAVPGAGHVHKKIIKPVARSHTCRYPVYEFEYFYSVRSA